MRRRLLMLRKLRERKALEDDGGWTLVELLVAMGVAGVALVLLVPIMTSVNYVVNSGKSSANASAAARNSLRQLTSDIGSANGNNVCIPSAPLTMAVCPTGGIASGTGSTLRVLSNVNNVCTWVQWSVSSNQLVQQSWPAASVSGAVTAVAVPIVSGVSNTVSQPVFTLTSSTNYVTIFLALTGSTGNAAGQSATANTSPGTGSQTVNVQTAVSVLPPTTTTPSGAC